MKEFCLWCRCRIELNVIDFFSPALVPRWHLKSTLCDGVRRCDIMQSTAPRINRSVVLCVSFFSALSVCLHVRAVARKTRVFQILSRHMTLLSVAIDEIELSFWPLPWSSVPTVRQGFKRHLCILLFNLMSNRGWHTTFVVSLLRSATYIGATTCSRPHSLKRRISQQSRLTITED